MRVTVESVFREQGKFAILARDEQELVETEKQLLVLSIVGLGLYGIGMGAWHSSQQALCAAVKLPILYLLSMAITLPALHFVGLLSGSKTKFSQTMLVYLHGVATTGILAAAFLPVVLFFLLTEPSYAFMLLLHVTILAFSSMAGLVSIHRNLYLLGKDVNPLFARYRLSLCFYGWMVLFAFVGTQLAYTLSPFLGQDEGFSFINPGEGNFYTALGKAISDLF